MTRIELQECKHTSREWQTKHEPNMVNSVINVNQGSFGVFSAYTRLDIDLISECTSVRPEPAVLPGPMIKLCELRDKVIFHRLPSNSIESEHFLIFASLVTDIVAKLFS